MRKHGNLHGRREISTTEGPSLTQQNMAEETDINNIVGRFQKSGQLPPSTRTPVFTSVTSESFHDMLNKVMDIDSAFDSLPPKLRVRFRNDPYQLVRFLEEQKNHPEAVKLGLMEIPDGFVMQQDGALKTVADADAERQAAADAADLAAARAAKAAVPPQGGVPKGDQ